jgi:hypothetical protein
MAFLCSLALGREGDQPEIQAGSLPVHFMIPSTRRGIVFLQLGLIVMAGLIVYAPALHGSWLWDDPQYVTANPLLHDPARLEKAWFVPGSTMEFYPLQETVIALQWWLWGAQPLGYHLTNLALHLVSALLLWRLFAQLGLRFAWLGGLLFVVHPLNVESVAWISELKNTLSLPPFLLAMIALVRYVDDRRRNDYFLALGFFTMAMLGKISMAPFPFVILLYLWWRRGRLGRNDYLLALPFLLVAVALSALTVWAYTRFGQLHPDHPFVPEIGGPAVRLALAVTTVSFYFARFFWPWEPMPLYPQWPTAPGLAFLLFLAWAGLLAWFWKERKSWGRPALLGLGFFLLMIAPFCGLVTQSYMYFTWVLDHLLYIPMIGLMGLGLAVLGKLSVGLPGPARVTEVGVLAVVVVLLAWQSRVYAGVWTDGGQLWSYAVQKNPGAWLAHYNLGNDFRRQGRIADAVGEYRTAIHLHPSFDWSHNNLGLCLATLPGGQEEAASEFREALRLRPQFPEAHANLANVQAAGGNLIGAIAEYEAALAEEPDLVVARYDLALALANAGRLEEAASQLRELLRRKPGYAPAKDLLARLPVH